MKNQRKKCIDKQHKQISVNIWLIMITGTGPDLPQRHS
jgi:hypothetical protein